MFSADAQSTSHSLVILFRLLNSAVILGICVVLQTMDPGAFVSVCGIFFCVTCGIFPLVMHLRASGVVKNRPLNPSWTTLKPVTFLALLLHLCMLSLMVGLFVLARKSANSSL